MSGNLDEKYISKTIALAKKGFGRVEPNPYVGCVIVKNGKIITSGYHSYFGGPHAEPTAVEKLLKSGRTHLLKGSTLYVNLEPCCHTNKKTPPCVPLIIKHGIKEVVVGMIDPNPQVNGKGIKQLENNGIRCRVGILVRECKELNKVYIKNVTKKMPYVWMKSAMTLDGKIATFRGDSKWITSDDSRRYVYKLRSQVDAVLVGVNTVLKDNPQLTSHNTGRNPVRVVIDPENTIYKTENKRQKTQDRFNVLDGMVKTIIFTCKEVKSEIKNLEFIKFSKTKNGVFDFKTIMKELYNRGIFRVLLEGGGETNWYALTDGVVDEVLIFIAPKVIGGREAKTPVEGDGIKNISDALKIKDITIEKIDNDILIKGLINHE